jgi:hypothetical protein
MKKNKDCFITLVITLLTVIIVACATTKDAGGYSEVVVRRIDNNNTINTYQMKVFVDGKSKATLKVGEVATMKIPNGLHTIHVNVDGAYVAGGGTTHFTQNSVYSQTTKVSSGVIQFVSSNTRHVFDVIDYALVLVDYVAFGNNMEYDLSAAVYSSFEEIAGGLQRNAKIAVIGIAADNAQEGAFAMEELTYLAVHSSKKFNVTDRRKIESLRIDRNYLRTSTMEDQFIMYVGNMLDTDFIVTGEIEGANSLRRLRVKAVEVRTGKLVAMASQPI